MTEQDLMWTDDRDTTSVWKLSFTFLHFWFVAWRKTKAFSEILPTVCILRTNNVQVNWRWGEFHSRTRCHVCDAHRGTSSVSRGTLTPDEWLIWDRNILLMLHFMQKINSSQPGFPTLITAHVSCRHWSLRLIKVWQICAPKTHTFKYELSVSSLVASCSCCAVTPIHTAVLPSFRGSLN